MTSNPLPIFDGHNDTLLRLYRKNLPVSSFFTQGEEGHLDLPRAEQGGFAGGLFACFVPSTRRTRICRPPSEGGYSVPFPGTPSPSGHLPSPLPWPRGCSGWSGPPRGP